MTEADQVAFVDALTELQLALGVDLSADRIAAYCRMLAEYELRHLKAACKHFEVYGPPDASRFKVFPTVPDFHTRAGAYRREEHENICICCKRPRVAMPSLGLVNVAQCFCVLRNGLCLECHKCQVCCQCPKKEG